MRSLSFLLVGACSCASLAGAPSLELLTFGPGTRDLWPAHINERGDIAFNYEDQTSINRPRIRWADGTIEDVALQHEAPYVGYFDPVIWGLSDAGDAFVLWDAFAQGMSDRRRIYRYARGGEFELTADVDRTPYANAWGGGGGHGAFLGADGDENNPALYLVDNASNVTFVGRPGDGLSIIRSVNDAGDVAGSVNRPGDDYPIRVKSDGSVELLTTVGNAGASGINNHGTVVGDRTIPTPEGNRSEMFLWRSDDSGVEFIETPDRYQHARSFAINDEDWIVGELTEHIPSDARGLDVRHAMVYTPDAGFINLNDLFADALDGVHLTIATGINESGTVIGLARLTNGEAALFLVTIPAPASALSLAALGLLAARRRR